MEKTRIIVTRVYEGKRTPQEAFVKAIIHSDESKKETPQTFAYGVFPMDNIF